MSSLTPCNPKSLVPFIAFSLQLDVFGKSHKTTDEVIKLSLMTGSR